MPDVQHNIATTLSSPPPFPGRNLISTKIRPLSELNQDEINRWTDLENRLTFGNPYLSPNYVIPSVRYLVHGEDPFVVTAEIENPSPVLIGIGLFNQTHPTVLFPLPHLNIFQTNQAFLNGFLLDQSYAQKALGEITACLRKNFPLKRSILMNNIAAMGPLHECLSETGSPRPYSWIEFSRYARSILKPGECGEDFLQQNYSKSKRKNLRLKFNRLSRLGKIEWRLVRNSGNWLDHIETFLKLENMGWKGQNGTSLLANQNTAHFFRQVTSSFANANKLFIAELLLDNKVISSTTNFVSGKMGFAYKIGWHSDYAEYSPGILNEIEMIKSAPELLHDLELIDSGSREGSYIDDYWKDRYPIVSGMMTFGFFHTLAAKGIESLKHLKKDWKRKM